MNSKKMLVVIIYTVVVALMKVLLKEQPDVLDFVIKSVLPVILGWLGLQGYIDVKKASNGE